MGAVIGDLLPLAVGVAISPIPIIAVILMLLAPRAGAASMGFTLGWTIGIVAVTGVVTVLAAGADVGTGSGGGSETGDWIKLGLGVLLLLVAARQWRSRPAAGETARAAAMDECDRPDDPGQGDRARHPVVGSSTRRTCCSASPPGSRSAARD